MGTRKEMIDLLLQTAETVGKKNPKIIEAEIKAEVARNFFSAPLIVERTSADDIPELPTPQTSLSQKYQED